MLCHNFVNLTTTNAQPQTMPTSENVNQPVEEFATNLNILFYSVDLQSMSISQKYGDLEICLGYDPFESANSLLEIPARFIHPDDHPLIKERHTFISDKKPGSWSGIYRVKQTGDNWLWLYSQFLISVPIKKKCRLILNGFYHWGLGALQTHKQLLVLYQQLNGIRYQNDIRLLSKQEIKIIQLIAEGKTYHEIAEVLFISPQTVNSHKKNILKKLKLKKSAALSSWAIYAGLV